MLSKLCQKYWIPVVGIAMSRILPKYVVCRRLQTDPGCQLMADVPVDMVCPDEAPFTRVEWTTLDLLRSGVGGA